MVAGDAAAEEDEEEGGPVPLMEVCLGVSGGDMRNGPC